MSSEYMPDFPPIFPDSDIQVSREDHFYETTKSDSGEILEVTEYTLDKAPVQNIVEVVGVHDGQTQVFSNGIDYDLSEDGTQIVWLDGQNHPDPGSTFYVTYNAESILSRYIRSSSEEFDHIDEALHEVIESKFIGNAEGEELDRIGAMFGELGKRQGREDPRYRTYLSSIVQSFVSRGTPSGIISAVAAATGIDQEYFSIEENFDDNSYEIVMEPREPVSTSIIEEVVEIADPSGVSHALTRFDIESQPTTANDDATFTISQSYFDSMGMSDLVNADDTSQTSIEGAGASETVNVTVEENVYWGNNWGDGMNWS